MDGNDIALIGTGETVYHCLQAGKELQSKGIMARVIDMHTLKPIDRNIIDKAARETKGIITVEEHSIFGGLGGAVAEIVTQVHPIPLHILGIPDEYVVHGTPLQVFKHYGIDSKGISDAALSFINSNRK